jgi:hypothetical protein
MNLSGKESATFWLLAFLLNQLCYRVPLTQSYTYFRVTINYKYNYFNTIYLKEIREKKRPFGILPFAEQQWGIGSKDSQNLEHLILTQPSSTSVSVGAGVILHG